MNEAAVQDRFDGSEEYSIFYYGLAEPAKANYRNYGPHSQPHWARPLAAWIAANCASPVLDVGCAFGHLVRELNSLGVPAAGAEWSQVAVERRVHPSVTRQDARALQFDSGVFQTVVSLDLLEHFEPADTLRVIDEMARVATPAAWFVHVIGAHNPADPLDTHMSDPTHKNHEPLSWYLEQFAARGVALDPVLTATLQRHPVFAPTDWAGRIVALRR